jgi:hypothetical protein
VPKWRLMSEKTEMGRWVKKFFPYVSEGQEGAALGLLEGNGVEYDGLRTLAVRDGNLVITLIITYDTVKCHNLPKIEDPKYSHPLTII